MPGDIPEAGSGDQRAEHMCEACGKSFDSEAGLRRHVRRVGIVE